MRFGPEVMDTVVSWTKSLCMDILRRHVLSHFDGDKLEIEHDVHDLSSWSVLDLGTGNGLLLLELAKQGEGAIDLARGRANRHGFNKINLLVDDVLDTKIEKQFELVMDKGTLDAIGLHPDGPIKRLMYWDSVSKLVAPGGILVITSCNSTKDELVQAVENFNQRSACASINQETLTSPPQFHYIDHVRSYPTFMFGGVVGSRVATVGFIRN